MAWKSFSDSAYSSSYPSASSGSPATGPSHRYFLPEILGILQGMVAALIFIALISARQGEQMIGAAGEWVDSNFQFVFGQYVVFVIPTMLAINALGAIFGRRANLAQYRSLIRGFGGLVLMIAACGFMSLLARVKDPDDVAGIFANGGVVGSFLVDYEGLYLTRYLGKVGAFVVLGGAGLIGLILFTERMIRDFGWLVLRGLGYVFLPGRVIERIEDAGGWFRRTFNGSWFRVIGRFLGGINFRHEGPRRVLAPTPILGLRPAGGDREIARRLSIPRLIEPPPGEPANDAEWDDYEEPEDDRWSGRESEPPPEPPRARGILRRPAPVDDHAGWGLAPEGGNEDDEDENDSDDAVELISPRDSRGEFGEEDFEDEESEDDDSDEDAPEARERYVEYEDEGRESAAFDDSAPPRKSGRTGAGEVQELFGAPVRKPEARPASPSPGRAGANRFEDSAASREAAKASRVFRIPRAETTPDAEAEAEQQEFKFERNFQLPSLDLLQEPPPATYRMSQEEANELSRRIEQTLAQFKIEVEVFEVVQGPAVTRFAMSIAPGIRVNKILALENDLALALKAQQIRILAPIPGQAAVGIEVPNKKTNGVFLRDLLSTDAHQKSRSPLSFALGMNISGDPVIADLAQMPHLLIAGATGSGKSVCLNTILASLLFRNPPEKVKFVMVDPKRVELAVYQAIPHLIAPVVCEPKKAAAALAWTVELMEERYKLLAELGVRNIDGYNAIVTDKEPNRKAMGRVLKYMPHIVVVIDELADLMMVARNEVEEYIIRLAQMARAVGIHLILATQRPSVNVITGIIKANFPSRIAFKVSSKVDSRTILDMNGAQALLGRGDMLYSPGGVKPFRIQGAFVSDEEIERLADYIRSQEKVRYEKEDFGTDTAAAAQKARAQLVMQCAENSTPGNEDDADTEAGDGEAPAALNPRADAFASASRANSVYLPPADMDSLSDEELFDIALKLVLESKKASVSYIQRRLKIGYARAGRLMDMMEERGIVGPYQGSKPRDLMVDPDEFRRRMAEAEN